MHWRNSQFQTLYFIVGSCHTADEAWRKAKEQLEEREMVLDAQPNNIAFPDTPQGRNALACINECKREIDFLKDIISRLEPYRKYKDLPDHEAHQACQREEWALEFKFRSENYLMSLGFVPHDQLSAMRTHPDWSEIQNHIVQTKALLAENKPLPALMSPAKEILCLTSTQS
jgi:hypothetical protein